MREVLIGQTDYTVLVKIIGTDGAPETGLAHTDIDIAYARVETDNDVTTSDVTPADLANLTAAHTDWGWEEVSSTDHPGLYRLDIADAVFATGAWEAVVTITDASGTDFYPVDIGFRLVSFNVQDGVRLGLTALPNAAADAAGGLPISDAGGLDLDAKIGALTFTVANKVDSNVTHNAGSAITSSSGRQEVNLSHIAGSAVSTSTAQLGVNVVNFGGSAGTFSSGRPEVNTTHIGGSTTPVTNIGVVYNTDFATNYDATNDRWTVNVKTWNDLTTVALPLVPTTAGRTLDVSAGGEAGVDWANVGSPTTTLNLSGTTVKTATDVATAIAALNNLSAAQVNTEVDTALADAFLTPSYTDTVSSATTTSVTIGIGLGSADRLVGHRIEITSGLGRTLQQRIVVSTSGGGTVFNVDRAWTVTPEVGDAITFFRDSLPKLDANLKVQGVVLTDTVTTYTGNTPQTGDSFARIGAPAGASVSADIAAIEAQTDDIGAAGAGLTALGDTRLANLDATVSSRQPTIWANAGSTVNLSATTIAALSTTERDALAAALLDLANGIETGVTPRTTLRTMAAIIAGLVTGAGSGTEVFKGIGQASGGTTRATVTVDSSGNRSGVTIP